jgi:peroxiredoxin
LQWDYDLPPDKFVARLTDWRILKDSLRKVLIAKKAKRPYSKNVREFLRADSLNDLYWTVGGFRDYHSYVLGKTSMEDSFFVENVKPYLIFSNDDALLGSDIYRGIWNKYIADQYTWKRMTSDSMQVKDKNRTVFRLEEITKQIPGKLRDIVLGRMIQNEYTSNYNEISESGYAFYDSLLNEYGKRLANPIVLQQAIAAVNTKKEMRKNTAKGTRAPEFSLIDTAGNIVKLSDFKGKIIYIDTWASWCAPCIGQLPSYRKLVERFKDRNDIVFLSISIDDNRPAWIEKGVNKHQPPGLQLWSGPKGGNSEFAKQYFITAIPKQILIDKEGRIINYNAESPDSKNVEKSIGEALGL